MTQTAKSLNRRAFEGMAKFFAFFWLVIFFPAWDLRFWQGWIYWLIFCGGSTLITVYFLKHDPGLIERRMRAGPTAEQERSQKIIQGFASLFFMAAIVVPGLDHHFGWSTVPAPVVFASGILVVLGFVSWFFVFKTNSFAASTIQIAEGQRVITTGPYRWVRHPMYAGALPMFLGTPLALGSWWGLLAVVPLVGVIVWRLLDEERFLALNLAGYAEYCRTTPHRLIPFVW